MIKTLTSFLQEKGIIFKEFHSILPKELGSRKKIQIFDGIDTKNNHISIFYIKQTSRFLLKNANELHILQTKLIEKQEHNYKKNILFIQAPLCSKANKYLTDLKWSIYHDTL